MSEFPKTLGRRIARFRGLASLTQEQLAEESGVATRTVYGYERGDFAPKAERLPRICDALGVTADELLGMADLQSMDTDNVKRLIVTKVRRSTPVMLRALRSVLTLADSH